jgi:methionyl-tRNA formyltransferase
MNAREKFSCYIIGAQSLLVQCAELLLEAGHEILGVITSDDMIGNWATERGIRRLDSRGDYLASLREQPFDYFFSITNLSIIPAEVLALPRRGAINFHDGPLPRYGGLYATAWALINREPTHGVTWHLMTNEVDRGDILEQEHFEIDEGETSLTLNAKCYEAGIGSFRVLLSELAGGQLRGERHALDESTYCPRSKRPAAASTLSWDCSAADLAALVRALDFGTYPNPLGLPKMVLGDEVVVATRADLAPRTGAAPGTLVGVGEDTLQVATTDDDLVLAGFHTLSGRALRIEELLAGAGLRQGALLPALGPARRERLTLLNAAVCRHESFWIKRLMSTESEDLPYLRHTPEGMAAP